MSLFICFPFPHFGSLADLFPSPSFCLSPSLLSTRLTPLTSLLPRSQSAHNTVSFSRVPHSLQHRPAWGLTDSPICLLRVLPVFLCSFLSVCGNPCLSKSVSWLRLCLQGSQHTHARSPPHAHTHIATSRSTGEVRDFCLHYSSTVGCRRINITQKREVVLHPHL